MVCHVTGFLCMNGSKIRARWVRIRPFFASKNLLLKLMMIEEKHKNI